MTFYARHRQPPQSWAGYVDGWVMDMQARGLSEHTIEANWYRLTCFARTQTRGCFGSIVFCGFGQVVFSGLGVGHADHSRAVPW